MTHISIPNFVPVSVNRVIRKHWAARRQRLREDADLIAGYAMIARAPKAKGKRRVSVAVMVTNLTHAPDPDNILKSALDALVKCGQLIDDSAQWCEIGKITVGVGKRETVITLEDV